MNNRPCDISLNGPSALHSEMYENGDLDDHIKQRHPEYKQPYKCQHNWVDWESQCEREVKCSLCGCLGERDINNPDDVFWPVT